ncbi:MAG TPA: aspartyl/asparaginyl beta-hydroxylase domain-containing protein [Sphingomicrobium sp.]|jgi:tetratricopeptide (TPR) repeat protein|nr:aspartyl/asparaginyl beta-hydroxylase domain-containing protein [Sphingomicrobium sp.]
MSRTIGPPLGLQDEADAAAGAGDVARALELLEQAVKQAEASPELWIKLSAMRRASGDSAGALKAVERALSSAPLDFTALLSRAFILERLGDVRAGEAFLHAAAQEPPEDRIPPSMRKAVEHARRKAADHRTELEARLASAIPSNLSEAEGWRVARFVSNASRRTRHFHQEPTDFHYPGLPEIEFHDREQFPELDAVEAAVETIRREFDALIAAEAAEMVPYIQYPDHVPVAQWAELNKNRNWTAIHLLQNGQRVEANARHCPETMEVLARLPQPNVPGASPNAMFSLLAPRTRIPPHTGVANTRLVCHLPLIVPPNCRFRVGATTRNWEAGQAFVFDDTIEHEAWNDSDELRVVMIFDLWPPALDHSEREAVAAIISVAGVSFKGA